MNLLDLLDKMLAIPHGKTTVNIDCGDCGFLREIDNIKVVEDEVGNIKIIIYATD